MSPTSIPQKVRKQGAGARAAEGLLTAFLPCSGAVATRQSGVSKQGQNMDILEVEAKPREARGSVACKRLRKQDLVPAILYGHGEPNVLLSMKRRALERLIEDHSFIVCIAWDGQHDNAQMKAIQYDALGDRVIHVDFMRISLTETVSVSVPVETHGEAAGVTEGGILELVMHELEVECLPTAIPERLRVELAGLGIGDSLRVADIVLPEGVVAVAEPEAVVVHVAAPVEEEEEGLAGLAEEALEPEVIGREASEEEQEEEQ
jgi:large subunit ribosomal protein L25